MVKAFYKKPEDIQKVIDDYFIEHGDKPLLDEDGNPLLDKNGNAIVMSNPPTISGLALHLGFMDRQSIYDYAKRNDEFSCTIKKAIMRIEEYAEAHLYMGKPTGAIFWLKNHKWIDKQEQDITVNEYSLFEKKVEEKAKKYEHKPNKRRKKRD
jgi:hypothetical protein